jgi:hypothetical protein
MVKAVYDELAGIGVSDTPGVAVADSGYWHEQQIDEVVKTGTQVLIHPMPASATLPAAAGAAAVMRSCGPCSLVTMAAGFTETQGDGRAGVRPNQAQPPHQPVPATRQIRRTLGGAVDHRDSQPHKALHKHQLAAAAA